MRSAVSGAVLAVASFAMYWWHWQSLGEAQARASSLIVLLAGYQTLISAERPALPALLERIPRTLVFWTVWAVATGVTVSANAPASKLARKVMFRLRCLRNVGRPTVDPAARCNPFGGPLATGDGSREPARERTG